jgi:arylsulfatase A-like enzyme
MRAIMVMFDSLNRRMLSPYGCDWVHTPNFQRLAERSATFDKSFVGSMPCMPARRELHTGRYNFLHRSWGPLEPFDDSAPEILRKGNVYTHLVSDHQHYWEDGGCTYHHRYSTWEIVRGQEGDRWKADLNPDFPIPESDNNKRGKWSRQDWINRSHMADEESHCQNRTFNLGLEFIETNRACDNWFLQIETFDPHEPYYAPQRFRDMYPSDYQGPHWDWPPYSRVSQPPEAVAQMRCESAALHSMCDENLGRVLDLMDDLDLWQDTMLIINTDHGFLLGEHDWWAKCAMPFYNEVANSPLFIWDPRCGVRDEHRQALVQTIDLPATLLDYFGCELPPDMQGKPLGETVANDAPVREAALYGIHGGHVNCTDGRYTYMRAPVSPDNTPLNNYTLMPTHMRALFSPAELKDTTMSEPLAFTKGCPVMKIPAGGKGTAHSFGTLLFDTANDPDQKTPIHDPAIEERMAALMIEIMQANDAPPEQFQRLGLG